MQINNNHLFHTITHIDPERTSLIGNCSHPVSIKITDKTKSGTKSQNPRGSFCTQALHRQCPLSRTGFSRAPSLFPIQNTYCTRAKSTITLVPSTDCHLHRKETSTPIRRFAPTQFSNSPDSSVVKFSSKLAKFAIGPADNAKSFSFLPTATNWMPTPTSAQTDASIPYHDPSQPNRSAHFTFGARIHANDPVKSAIFLLRLGTAGKGTTIVLSRENAYPCWEKS